MKENTLRYAETKGFKLETKVSGVLGMRKYLVKSNVKILVASYANGDGKYEKPDAEIMAEIDSFSEMKEREDFLDSCSKETEKEMLAND